VTLFWICGQTTLFRFLLLLLLLTLQPWVGLGLFNNSIPLVPVYQYYSKIFNVIIDWDYWRNKDPLFPEVALIWFNDSSTAKSGTGSGIFGLRPNGSFSFPLGKYASFSN